jgi:type VI protein secretion system component Hcp
MPIYMKIEPEIKGEVTAEGYRIRSRQQLPVRRRRRRLNRRRQRRQAVHPRASISEITVTAGLDNATGPMLDKLCAGTVLKKVTISFTRASSKDAAGNDGYLIVTLEDVFSRA